ncbi:MAG: polysaccharide pyruvyl transferase family protein, partial [Acidobacteriaceae bacterium]|nr:polysaccharide pyruvyl transferase family protein [Acidobacteriaceae bacterium]
MLSYDRSTIVHFAKDLVRTPFTAVNRRLLRAGRIGAVGYIGWVGHSNLGDEAMFEQIKAAFPDFELVPLLPEPGERLISHLGAGPGIFDAVLLGGGTLMNCDFIGIAQLVREQSVPLFVVGTGVGSPGFSRPENGDCLDAWARLCQSVPLAGVRGPYSRDILERAGTPDVRVI